MGKIKTDGLIAKAENVFGEKFQIYLGPTPKKSHAWEEKDYTQNCQNCLKFIDRTEAINIIKIVNENESRNNGWIPPLEEHISGICMFGL